MTLEILSVGQRGYNGNGVGEVLGGRAPKLPPPPPHHLHAHQEEHYQPLHPGNIGHTELLIQVKTAHTPVSISCQTFLVITLFFCFHLHLLHLHAHHQPLLAEVTEVSDARRFYQNQGAL